MVSSHTPRERTANPLLLTRDSHGHLASSHQAGALWLCAGAEAGHLLGARYLLWPFSLLCAEQKMVSQAEKPRLTV